MEGYVKPFAGEYYFLLTNKWMNHCGSCLQINYMRLPISVLESALSYYRRYTRGRFERDQYQFPEDESI